ncbi:MAG: NAD(P)H-binding protein [Candidatus Nitrosopolaris sp.]
MNGVQVVQLDHNKPDTLAATFKDVDKLFLLTPGQPNVADVTTHLVNEAKNARVKHIVRRSAMGADVICQLYYCQ